MRSTLNRKGSHLAGIGPFMVVAPPFSPARAVPWFVLPHPITWACGRGDRARFQNKRPGRKRPQTRAIVPSRLDGRSGRIAAAGGYEDSATGDQDRLTREGPGAAAPSARGAVGPRRIQVGHAAGPVSYTHLRAH